MIIVVGGNNQIRWWELLALIDHQMVVLSNNMSKGIISYLKDVINVVGGNDQIRWWEGAATDHHMVVLLIIISKRNQKLRQKKSDQSCRRDLNRWRSDDMGGIR